MPDSLYVVASYIGHRYSGLWPVLRSLSEQAISSQGAKAVPAGGIEPSRPEKRCNQM